MSSDESGGKINWTCKEEVIKSGALARFPLLGEVWLCCVWNCLGGDTRPPPGLENLRLARFQEARRQALGSQHWERPLNLVIQWYYLRPTTAAETLSASCPHGCCTNCPVCSQHLRHLPAFGRQTPCINVLNSPLGSQRHHVQKAIVLHPQGHQRLCKRKKRPSFTFFFS